MDVLVLQQLAISHHLNEKNCTIRHKLKHTYLIFHENKIIPNPA